ncbi:MAG: formyltransferase [Chitinivorax sp.]
MASAVVFAYHNVGVRCLSVLLAHGVDVRLVVTHQDNPNETIWFGSVAELARRHGIEVITPTDPNTAAVIEQIRACRPDFIFSFYYRNMLKREILVLAPCGAYNMHGSLLPKYRGRVPVNWAIIHGESETGATLHVMNEKPDNGAIVDQQAVPILPDDTASEVFDKVTVAAEMALNRCLPALLDGNARLTKQDLRLGGYFGGRKPEDGRIDWYQSAATIHNLIRAVAPPYPGAYCEIDGQTVKLLRSMRIKADGLPAFAAPTLFTRNNRLLAQAGDGGYLAILDMEYNGEQITPQAFAQRFGEVCPLAR